MQVKAYWKVSSLLLSCLILSSCASWPQVKQVEVKTVEVERQIPIQNRPSQLRLNTNMKWWVVTEENFKQFKEEFQKENGDYETLALNMAEIKRYLEQQKSIIIYYEDAIKPKSNKEKETK